MHSPFGIVETDADGRVSSFLEKPVLPHWINIGFLLCEPEALDRIQPGSSLPEYLNCLSRDGRLFSYKHRGRHLTVNTEKERQSAESEVIELCNYADALALRE